MLKSSKLGSAQYKTRATVRTDGVSAWLPYSQMSSARCPITKTASVKAAAVALLGIPAVAIVIFEVALNGFALFNHANIRLSQKWDDRVGRVLITQRLHRIHHSQAKAESNSNYGFSVSWWDRLFNSFTPRAQYSDETLPIGQKDVPAVKGNASIRALLMQPFKNK